MVREESHLDDMRAAIRGDFERLAERRGSQELMREENGDAGAKPSSEPVRAPESPSEQEPEPLEAHAAEERVDAEPSEDDPPRKSWLARALGL